MTRTPGLKGLKPQRQGDERFAIKWMHEYLEATPTPSYPIDVSKGITDWQMLGNDQYGDCVPAAVAHDRMLAGAAPTAQEVEDLYLAYDNGVDEGVVIADFLLYLFQKGLIEGFAPVAPSTVDTIMAEFNRGILLGVSLTDDAEQLFTDEQPWGSGSLTPDPNEGHGILLVKSQSASGPKTVVTWGADQEYTLAWGQACVDEAWAIVTKDDMGDAAYAALLADLSALPHATDVPPSVEPPAPDPVPPQPEPEPAPTPVPDPVPPTPVPDPAPPQPEPIPDPVAPPTPAERLLNVASKVEHEHFLPHALREWVKEITEFVTS